MLSWVSGGQRKKREEKRPFLDDVRQIAKTGNNNLKEDLV
jgi:hypothetical protein